ncbi:MAG: hypothetical protein FWC73_06125 [Defluviitaleaceae bacterium]|nr:hypothetical protein [Defluviitaleaceae bacterium]
MKKIYGTLFLTAILLLILAGCSRNHFQGEIVSSYAPVGYIWMRGSIDDLAYGATHIVRAEVLDNRTELINTLLSDRELREDEEESVILPHTVHRLRVLEVFMGDVVIGDIIEIAQRGGRVGNRELINDRKIQLVYGYELVFFLHCVETHGFRPMPMMLESSSQAVYHVASQDADSTVVLESFTLGNNLVLTVGDLERIAEEFGGGGPTPTPLPPSTEMP